IGHNILYSKNRAKVLSNWCYGQIALALGRSKSNIQRAVAPWTRDRYQAVKANEYALSNKALG
ncbi:MAG: hypothetical protein QM530_09885, partial [Phycisphaerales bacterium]|nr:hypothetical protein [Phycisphaerales bacterium]